MPRSSLTVLQLWSLEDKENPELLKTIEFEGSYISSRKIDDRVYFVIKSQPDYAVLEEPLIKGEELLPAFRETNILGQEQEFETISNCTDIKYFDKDNVSEFITLGSLSMTDPLMTVNKEVMAGSGSQVYASKNNLYLAQAQYDYIVRPAMPLIGDSWGPKEETIIHKFGLSGSETPYFGSMTAPGSILNQFSMDEFNGFFRIATTIGHVSQKGGGSTNNVYIFDSARNLVGSLEDLAPGEKIYSARFMGEKGYIVTFKKVDPLFVIDLSIPSNPRVLGQLKIPGYSDYLHPIDETHLIGIGKDTVEAEQQGRDFAWYQGVKIAVFDVTDVANPIELHKEIIGDRGTDSLALQDHKAFLFDKEKELLVIPVTLAELSEEQKESGEKNAYGKFTFQGAYVYNLNLENGFELKGRITHVTDEESFDKAGYRYYNDLEAVKRSLFIDNVLYTISDSKIKLNNLTDLQELKELNFDISSINSFEDCINAGYPIMESFPAQCRTPDGRTFKEIV
ncbi:MAG: beta-propeller domain-containing protein, partial [archaeon]